MALGAWLRALDAVSGLVEMGQRLKRGTAPEQSVTQAGAPGGPLEARLAGVLVAALKEAFDRDRARLELEQSQVDAERRRADEAMRLELRRQAGDRAVGHARMLVAAAVAAWIVSALLLVFLPGAREMPARGALAFGWALLFGCIGTAFASYFRAASWLGSLRPGAGDPGDVPADASGRASGFLLIAGMAAIAAALLLAV